MKKLYIHFFAALVISALCSLSASAQSITNFSPATGPAGTAVTITGTGFNTTAVSNIVYFGPVRATVTAASATSLTVTAPITAGYNNISVTNLGTNLTAYSAKPYNLEFLVSGEQSFADGIELITGTQPTIIAAGDLDSDGSIDLVTANSFGSISIFRNLSAGTPSFSVKSDLALGGTTTSMTLSDIDGDGKKDIIAANPGPSYVVAIYRNTSTTGTISFAPRVDLPSLFLVSVAAGDLNQDGKPDLVVAGNNQLVAFRNTSTVGNISFVKTVTAVTAISSVAIGDIDGDNLPDVAAITGTSPAPNILAIFRNTSTTEIQFAAKVDFTATSSGKTIAISDLDGDGKSDVMVSGSACSVFRNTSVSGVISLDSKIDLISGVPYTMAVGDLDGDGKPEIVTGNANSLNGGVAVFKNTSSLGTLQFQPRVEYSVGTQTVTYGVVLADLNADGRPDIAAANQTGTNANKVVILRNISVFPPPSVSSFTPLTGIPGATVTITGSNFNTTAASNKVTFGATAAEVTAASSTSLTVKVPNGATYSRIEVLNTSTNLKGISAGGFSPSFAPVKDKSVPSDMETKVDYPTNLLATGVVVSDIDGDGKADMAVANQSPAVVSVYRNNSVPGTFTSSSFNAIVNFTTAGAPVSIVTADLDNDGKNEMITANGTSLNLSIFRNTATPGSISSSSFAAKADITTGVNTTVVAVSDINVDGKPDLLYLTSGVSTLSIVKNNSVPGTITSGSFASAVTFATGSSPAAIATGDLNGDGKPEVVVANSGSNSISVYNNTSVRSAVTTSSLAAKIDFTVGTTPGSVTIGDLNGDGKPEIIVANRNDGNVSIFRNISTSGAITTASFAAKKEFNTGGVVQVVTISDINGDGKPDLLNTTTSGTTLLQNTTTDPTNILFATVISYPTVSSPKMAAAADLDGDFKPEIILASSTVLSVLRNNPNNKPVATTVILASATSSSASVSGTVNDNGETTAVSFEYGLAPDLSDAQTVAATTGASVAAGTGNTTSSVTLTGLSPAKNYFYRIKAQNASGTTVGATREISTHLNQTPLAAPVVSYGEGLKEFKTGTAITPLQPVNTGGEVPPGVYLETTTLAGSGTFGYADGIGSQARFDAVTHVVADGLGNLYISDELNYRIRKLVLATNEVSTVAGSGNVGSTDGTGTAASFNLPAGLALDGAGNLYVADLSNHRIRKIVLATGVVTTLAGSTFGFVNGTGSAAKFNSPWGIVYSGTGYLYVADQSNNAIRRVNLATQAVTSETLFGLNNPVAIALDKGQAYILDQNNKVVRRFDLASKLSFILATSTQTQFNTPYDIVTDGAGNLYVADSENHVIKKVSISTGTTTVLAGSGTSGFADGLGTTAKFKSPVGVSYDRSSLYVADGNDRIRRISLSGYDITPALPAGLAFDNKTGIISGTPTVVSATQSYTINAYNAAGVSTAQISISTVVPPISTNADLASLTLNKGVLAPAFAAATSSYQTLLSDTAKTIIIKPLAADSTATVKINGQLINKDASATISLITGVNTITTLVTAQDTTVKKTYSLAVTVPVSPVPQEIPVFSPSSGAIAFGTTISITSAGADSILYTTNGADPLVGGTLYTAPVPVNAALTLKAVAKKSGKLNSVVATGTYTQAASSGLTALSISNSPSGFNFNTSQSDYSISFLSPLAVFTVTPSGEGTITVDGVTVSSGTASVPIALTAGVEKSVAITITQTGRSARVYTIKAILPLTQETPVFSQAAGPITFGTSISIISAAADSILYTTNGGDPLLQGILYTAPVAVNSVLTFKAIAKKAGKLNSAVASAAYTQAASAGLTALSVSNSPSGYSFNTSQSDYSITFSNPLATFTATPSGEGTITVNGVALSSGTPSAPIAITAGVEKLVTISITQAGKSARVYTIKAMLPLTQETPVFSQVAGPIAFGTTVSISSTAADTILYTTNGNDPLVQGIRYTAPIAVNAAISIKAVAKKTGRLTSVVATADYIQAASAGLTALTVSNNPGGYSFNGNTLNYGISFPNSTADFTITPTGQGTIIVNGFATASGTASAPIALTPGVERSITISFTEAGKTGRIYTIKATRAEAGQLITDNTGKVTLSATEPQVLITSPTQPITVSVPVGTVTPSIDYSALITGGTGIIPQTTVTSNVANMAIPASVTVTSSSPSWNGVLAVPTITSYDLPPNTGEITTYGLTIEVGSPDVSLSFDKGIRLLLPGQAGKRAGFVHGGVFAEITRDGATDSQAEADLLPPNSAYKINVGPDLVIWTKAFSKFLTFTRSTDPDIALLAFDKDVMSDDVIKGQNTDLTTVTQSLVSPLPLTGPNGSTITWSSSDAAIVSPSGIIKRPIFGSGDATVTLTATFKKGLITDTRTYIVSVVAAPNSAPTLAAIVNQTLCATTASQTIALSGITAGAETSQQITLTVGSNNTALFSILSVSQPLNGSSVLSYTLAPGISGTAFVTVTAKDNGGVANGGADTFVRTFTIQVNALPAVQLSSSVSAVSKGRTAVLTASGGSGYSWAAAAGIVSGQNSAVLTVRPAVTTSYTVTVTNASGCTSTQSIMVNVLDDYQALDAMNIMTPNGDGVNDFLIIKNLDMYPNNTLRVFDKAGRQIYIEQNYANKWAGTLNGSTLAEGTYFYFLDFANGKGKVKGFVSIAH